MEPLDINKLIEAAETLVDEGLKQGKIHFAAEGRQHVQVFTGEDGNKYSLDVVLSPYKESKMQPYEGDD